MDSYPWIVSFLIQVFTFICGNFTLFIITTFILGTSAFLLSTHSNHNVQVTQHKVQVIKQEGENDSNQAAIVENQGFLDVGSPDSCSESEIIDHFSCTTEEESEFDGWDFSGEVCRKVDCSDGSISDDESLIEIELLGGHSVGYKENSDEEEPKICRRQKSPDSVLWWPEMNEEENMIEIDLSVGSIKC